MKIQVLDGLRGYSALIIVLAHMPQISNTELGQSFYFLISNLKLSYLGVDFFFILSGFLITRILIKEKNKEKFSLRLFYLKRALRIFPIYYLTIVVCGLFFSWQGMGYLAAYNANYYLAFESELHPLEHAWFLSVEVHYYLVWPLLFFIFKLKHIKKYTLPIIILIILISLVFTYQMLDEQTSNRIIYMSTQFRILSLGVGSILAFHEKKISSLNKKIASRWLSFFFLVFYLLAIFSYQGVFNNIAPIPVVSLFLFSACASCFFMLVLIQEKRKNSLDSLFSNKPIKYVGKISYGIYLYHYPIFFGWGISKNQLEGKPIEFIEFIFPLTLVFLLAISSYWLLEKPIMNYKTKVVHRMRIKLSRI